MRTETKLISIAALIAGMSTAAIAETKTTESVPQSLETSRAVESDSVNSVETYTEEVPRAESAETTNSAEAGDNSATAVDSTLDTAGVPTSFETTDVAEALDINEMNDPQQIIFAPMNDTVVAWEDDEAAEMRAAIVANTMVSTALTDEGYSEEDVVAAYTRADGGLTLVVDADS
ncbi:hypothetical protein [Pseudooceanicola sp.]|uniref:hypothetical protein n=1 Tax=Pseudooceanicola sp. TaxID=1914328 RepID=UPI0035C6F0A8